MPVEVNIRKCCFQKLSYRVGLSRRDHIVIGLRLLQHQPHRGNIFFRITPIALRIQIPEVEFVLQACLDPRNCASDLSRDESFTAPRALVVEEYAAGGEQTIRFTIVNGHPMRVDFSCRIRTARIKMSRLSLRRLLRLAKHLRAACLVKLRSPAGFADSFQYADRAQRGYVTRIFRNIEADAYMTLRRQVINLVGLNAVKQFDEVSRVGNVAVMQKEADAV